jgi:hypothetical protein
MKHGNMSRKHVHGPPWPLRERKGKKTEGKNRTPCLFSASQPDREKERE